MSVATVRVLVLLAVVATAGCTSSKSGTQEHQAPIGRSVGASKLGVPVYPNARPGDPPSITAATDEGTRLTANFTTTDAFEKVYEYYRQHLPPKAETMKVTSGNGSVASFQILERGGVVAVQVSSDEPKVTNILITHVTRTRR